MSAPFPLKRERGQYNSREAPVDAVAPPKIRSGAKSTMELVLASRCTVPYNDIGLRQNHSKTCGDADYSAAKKAMADHLQEQGAAAR